MIKQEESLGAALRPHNTRTWVAFRIEWCEYPFPLYVIVGKWGHAQPLMDYKIQPQFLEDHKSFGFFSRYGGNITVRKEEVRNGYQHGWRRYEDKKRYTRTGWYWRAYKKVNGRLRKAYVGKLEEITLEKLEQVTQSLAGDGDAAKVIQSSAGDGDAAKVTQSLAGQLKERFWKLSDQADAAVEAWNSLPYRDHTSKVYNELERVCFLADWTYAECFNFLYPRSFSIPLKRGIIYPISYQIPPKRQRQLIEKLPKVEGWPVEEGE